MSLHSITEMPRPLSVKVYSDDTPQGELLASAVALGMGPGKPLQGWRVILDESLVPPGGSSTFEVGQIGGDAQMSELLNAIVRGYLATTYVATGVTS